MFRKFFYVGLAAAAALASALACPETVAAITAASQNGPIASQAVASQAVSLGTPEVPLTEWRYHPGDSPRMRESNTFLWADPAFNDSGWKQVKAKSLSAQNIPYSELFWYRSRVTFHRQDPAQKLAVLLEFTNTYQVYWNGRLLGSVGQVPPLFNWPYRTMKSFLLPLPDQSSVSGLLAVRVWCETPSLNDDPELCGFVDPHWSLVRLPWIGDVALAQQAPKQDTEHFMVISGFQVATSLLALLAGIISLIVYLRGRRNPIYLWFAVFLVGAAIAECPDYFFPFENWADLVISVAVGAQIAGLLLLLVWLLEMQQERWILRIFSVVAAVVAIDWILTGVLKFFGAYSNAFILSTYAAVAFPQNFTALLPLPLLILAMTRKRTVREWPVIAVATLYFAVALITDLDVQWPPLAWANHVFYLGYVAYWPNLVLFVLLLLTLAFSVYRHFVAERRQQEHSARELHAAQEVQRVLLPEKIAAIPGFAIASVYRPASEVGGDFFQILPLDSGATLVAIGDVSGKGLKAAMIVSLMVGTLRAIAAFTEEPAEILQQLNSRLHGRMPAGFVTCLVLRIDSSGGIVAAHAGHIFPYIDGKEFSLVGSVPLGIMPGMEYEQVKLPLAKGETLTLLTDGVPEAQNAKRELFGFDRLVALLTSKPTAEQVAETACIFGQKDDITVLTLTRLADPNDAQPIIFDLAAQEA